jgi:glycerol-3-phosphate O-acyltransferase
MNFGRIYVEICTPMSIRECINNIGKKNLTSVAQRTDAVQRLGNQIIHRMTEKLVVMNTGIVSCVLLMNRRGITEDDLIKNVNWIARYILKKGYRIGGIN